MIDDGQTIKDALLTQSALTALTGVGSTARLWPHRTLPIAGYKPQDGIAIGFRTRGGDSIYSRALMYPSVQFKVWGIDEHAARVAAGVLVDVLDGQSFSSIRIAHMEGLPQVAHEQDTDWVFGLVFFTIWLVR
jgi:hypothetical protein